MITGLYDNQRTGRREEWVGGELKGVASDWTFNMKPFGSYPDLPRPAQCVSCGAQVDESGDAPCGH